ncbi:MAG TPA: hypothetical protein VE954_42350 [Oligoflexus sp.]|uniref:hypothetical protein n=1 Tax=Oligoflexus sp. TaxID=1971216 RepID=UPI002D2BF3A8|nr:hypothetical protein [Oligoflexus sp.]HYX39783.1 hypothetical protein [Oligoflexus sp.]
MEKKENKFRLRLVKTTDEVTVDASSPELKQQPAQVHSAFARQMTDYADDLDRMIEAILKS